MMACFWGGFFSGLIGLLIALSLFAGIVGVIALAVMAIGFISVVFIFLYQQLAFGMAAFFNRSLLFFPPLTYLVMILDFPAYFKGDSDSTYVERVDDIPLFARIISTIIFLFLFVINLTLVVVFIRVVLWPVIAWLWTKIVAPFCVWAWNAAWS